MFKLLAIGLLTFWFLYPSYSQNPESKGAFSLIIMRPKKIMASGNGMNIYINDKLVYKLKSGRQVRIALENVPLTLRIVYPQNKKYESRSVVIKPSGESDVYVGASYKGLGKKFEIGIIQYPPDVGRIIHNDQKRFKRRKEIEKVNTLPNNG